MGGKITINFKNCTKTEKEETHAHRKRARSSISRERTLELRQCCTKCRECLVRLDKSRKSESSQNETLLYTQMSMIMNYPEYRL